jgi:hypothetical protein
MWIVCITSVRYVLTVNGYGGRQTKENEKSWCFKGWETLVTLFKKFIGYGHYKLIIADKEGTRMEAVTGDMDLISRLSSELEEEREKATKEAINYVLQES